MLSHYCNITNEYGINISVNKLVPNLAKKSKYVLRYRNLQLYLSLGMKLVSVHKVLKFRNTNARTTYTLDYQVIQSYMQ